MSMAALRSLAFNLVLFASLLISHHLGGGNFSFSPFLVPFLGLSFAYFLFWPVAEFTGPQLAAVLFLFQALGHMTLGSTAKVSDGTMVASHACVFLASYFVAAKLDKTILSLFELLFSYFLPNCFHSLDVFIEEHRNLRSFSKDIAPTPFCWPSLLNRGPPTLAIMQR